MHRVLSLAAIYLACVTAMAPAWGDDGAPPTDPVGAAMKFIKDVQGETVLNMQGDVVAVTLEGEWSDSLITILTSGDLAQTRDYLRAFPKLQSVSIRMRLDDPADLTKLADFPQLEKLNIEAVDDSQRLAPWLKSLAGCNRLRELDLGACNVGDHGLTHLSGIPSLRVLSLVLSEITEDGLKALRGLTLTELSLSSNALEGPGLAHLAQMRTLETLNLANNELGDDAVIHLRGLARLKNLDMTNNRLTDAGVATIARLPALSRLSLIGNPVTDASLKTLQSVKSLRNLSVANANVTIIQLRTFHQVRPDVELSFEPIQALGMQRVWGQDARVNLDEGYHLVEVQFLNPPSRKAFAALARFPKLERVTIGSHGIPLRGLNLDFKHFANLNRLKQLDLNGANLSDDDLKQLAHLQALETLSLGHTKITDSGLQHLKSLPQLQKLNVERTAISDAGLTELASWTSLKELNVCDTRVTMAGIRKFVEAHPQTALYEMDNGCSFADWRATKEKAKQGVLLRFSPRTALGMDKIWPSGTMILLNDRLEVRYVSLHCYLDENQLAHLERFKEIEVFNCSGIAISDATLRRVGRPPKLKRLLLWGSTVTDAGLAHLAGCQQLEELNLQSSTVTDQGLKHLAGLTQLRVLLLPVTRISDVGLASLKNLTALERLDLDSTRVTGKGLGALAGMHRLRSLNLSSVALSDDALANLRQLVNLETLNLNRTGTTDRGLPHLAVLPRLTNLYLGDNKVTDDGLPELYGLAQLRSLNLVATETTPQGRNDFRHLNPKLNIWPSDD